MRFIIRAQMPTEAGNKMMQKGNMVGEIENYMRNIKAEAAYFFEANGDRTIVFIANLEQPSQMATVAEPLFSMGAKVEFHPAMVIDDLRKIEASIKS